MKSIIAAIVILFASVCVYGETVVGDAPAAAPAMTQITTTAQAPDATPPPEVVNTTKGVFSVGNDIECHIISSDGSVSTNQLSMGKTYLVGNLTLEMNVVTNTTFYFSGGLLINVSPNSTLIINQFDQEVKNVTSFPRRAEFGSHNIVLAFNKGEFSVVYATPDTNSVLTVTTPHTGRLYTPGKYIFVVTDKETTVNIIEGNKNFDKTKKPIIKNDALPSKTKLTTTTKSLTNDETEKYSAMIAWLDQKANDVMFVIINGTTIGVWTK